MYWITFQVLVLLLFDIIIIIIIIIIVFRINFISHLFFVIIFLLRMCIFYKFRFGKFNRFFLFSILLHLILILGWNVINFCFNNHFELLLFRLLGLF